MTDTEPKAWKLSGQDIIIVRTDDKNVTLGFLADGERLSLNLEQGKLVPATSAQFYVTVAHGQPTRVQSRDKLIEEINRAAGDNPVRLYVELGKPPR